jgi:hypothetical protein
MNEDKRKKVEAAALRDFEARQRVKYLGEMNSNLEPEAARQAAVDYAVARAEAFEAADALRAAIEAPDLIEGTWRAHREENLQSYQDALRDALESPRPANACDVSMTDKEFFRRQ